MIWLHFFIVLVFIFLGTRLGGIGIGFAGGLGVVVLALFGLAPGSIPFDVISIIMAVIMAISAMQVAGGMDFLVRWAENLLRKHPKYITYLAPTVGYFMTLCAGTGHTAFSILPVIAEVAKEQGVRPSRPLSITTIASQIAITASPISAAVVYLAGELEKNFGIGYLQLLAIWIPTTFVACMITAFICNFLGKELKDDPEYQRRLSEGLIKLRGQTQIEIKPYAKRSVGIFLLTVIIVMFYATLISKTVGLIEHPVLPRNEAIISFMLAAAAVIVVFCKVDVDQITSAATFKSGMSASICVMGVAWLGNTFVGGHIEEIKQASSTLLNDYPWMLAVVLFFASTLLYSQAATAKALYPAAIALGVSPLSAIAAFAAVSALFVLPTYPTLLAAVEMDDTGSTRIGKFVFNHSFILPGLIAIVLSVGLGFLWGGIVLSI
ncbi:C4-dicarboxylate ABC transporter [Mergibacter septicus]|uniref:C4-dicarboxylate transporter n=1 Tax=Mergibacter septicus TaxID=221402 RepID=A0A8E3SC82_9PAST|nr:anaerobic C4-dicarboxylate transporter [Mergibacter septicus]AWX16082.1 C4-dicarboxylate ABC transporter [Mergibacter septicus]QDJ13536.1 C4-dicarboxylate ABC transporter [Mergibacter septicus]QDJ15335.1 C4-dicarboxylate ABC transporter [Mergibacter septicus]UTU48796.1 anaerobic C4-dicarboxylate transporter [Mergibacter septicus]WMR95573.1 anaerobic C4-dicarboxylate transporter [Mergibacter septicus]